MKAEGFKSILIHCAGPPEIPAAAAGTIPRGRWMDSPIGAGTILRPFQVHAVRLSWLGRSAPELVLSNRLSKGHLFALVYHLLIELCRMSISDELAKLIPIGEENAVSGLLLWKQLKMWSPMSIKHTLRLMARDGRIERKQVERDGRETILYFRTRS